MIGHIPQMLWRADPIYVDPEMMPLVNAALTGWRSEPLIETDMLIPDGFLVLPGPVYVRDVHDKRMAIRAFLWSRASLAELPREPSEGRETQGIALAMFSDTRDADDYPMPEEARHGRSTSLALTHVVPWSFGEDPSEFMQRLGSSSGVEVVQCILRLMSQTIAVRSERVAPRQVGRRMARARFPAKRITVVTLRRPEGPGHEVEHGSVEWSHRWVVDGHWRNQWYSSLGLHRQIWISPYVKGPEDLPLIVPKAHVFQFVR